MAATAWTLYNTVTTNEQIRESYYAVGSAGTMYKELIICTDPSVNGSKPFQPSPAPTNDHNGVKYTAEACFYIPEASPAGTPLVWTQVSATQNGDRYDELWTAPTPAGATTAGTIYRNTTSFFDQAAQGSRPFQPSPPIVQRKSCKFVSQSCTVGS
jgi:hypothetical protein